MIKRQNIYTQIVDHLKNYIVEKGLQPGNRLPTEIDLAEQLGVSRLSVREAIKVMESLGIVETRPRDGTRLKALTMKPMTDHLQFWFENEGITIQEMGIARTILECGLLPEVVSHAEESDYQRIEASIHKMRERTREGLMVADEDMEFHQSLTAATKNRALQGFGLMLHDFFRRVRETETQFSEVQWISIEDHQEIYEALRSKDVEAAQKAMKRHLYVYTKPTA